MCLFLVWPPRVFQNRREAFRRCHPLVTWRSLPNRESPKRLEQRLVAATEHPDLWAPMEPVTLRRAAASACRIPGKTWRCPNSRCRMMDKESLILPRPTSISISRFPQWALKQVLKGA